jgi:flagellar biosynthetic protein FliO
MAFLLTALVTPAADPWPTAYADGLRALVSVAIVLGLVGVLAWLVRRGSLRIGGPGRKGPIAIEASVPLGERRSLLIVTLEGRRLLLGLTPVQVSLLTELKAAEAGFESALTRELDPRPGGQA